MRSEDEDEEDEYDYEQEYEDGGVNGMNEEEGADEGEEGEEGDEPEASSEPSGEYDEEEDEEEGSDEEEDEEEDEDEDEAEGEGEDEDEDEEDLSGEQDPGDVQMTEGRTPGPPPDLQLPHLLRRQLFQPSFLSTGPIPNSLSIEAIVAIPLPSPVHSMASTLCSSYLLTGAQDGFVRAYNVWPSVNGQQLMSAQQKAAVGLGDGVNKAGVSRGWWANEVAADPSAGGPSKRAEPVYSIACEGDGLWALTGTKSGPINMYTLRHSPGHHVHTLKGHTGLVSCMTLLPDERGFISGSWDGTLREWDLNTGQVVRKYPSHGAQFSSISLRPFNAPVTPDASPRAEEDEPMLDGTNVTVNISDGIEARNESSPKAAEPPSSDTVTGEEGQPAQEAKVEESAADVEMDPPSPYDPLFDDDDADAAGSPALPDPEPKINGHKPPHLDLALPSSKQNGAGPDGPPQSATGSGAGSLFSGMPTPSASRAGAAANIPLLSPTTYKAFSDDILLASSMDGQVSLIDRRVHGDGLVGRLQPGDKAPPWCMSACWGAGGNQVLAGRRNGTVDIWDVRRSSSSSSSVPNLLRTLRTPAESGPVSCIVPFPDGRHVATASQDNVRLWNTIEYFQPEDSIKKPKSSRPPFKIIAGHHGGIVSSMIVDPTCRFLITASGDRGWAGESTRVVLIHEIRW